MERFSIKDWNKPWIRPMPPLMRRISISISISKRRAIALRKLAGSWANSRAVQHYIREDRIT